MNERMPYQTGNQLNPDYIKNLVAIFKNHQPSLQQIPTRTNGYHPLTGELSMLAAKAWENQVLIHSNTPVAPHETFINPHKPLYLSMDASANEFYKRRPVIVGKGGRDGNQFAISPSPINEKHHVVISTFVIDTGSKGREEMMIYNMVSRGHQLGYSADTPSQRQIREFIEQHQYETYYSLFKIMFGRSALKVVGYVPFK